MYLLRADLAARTGVIVVQRSLSYLFLRKRIKTKLVVKRYGHNENAGSPRKVCIVQNTLATADTVYVEH
jgi:hypothetical protein